MPSPYHNTTSKRARRLRLALRFSPRYAARRLPSSCGKVSVSPSRPRLRLARVFAGQCSSTAGTTTQPGRPGAPARCVFLHHISCNASLMPSFHCQCRLPDIVRSAGRPLQLIVVTCRKSSQVAAAFVVYIPDTRILFNIRSAPCAVFRYEYGYIGECRAYVCAPDARDGEDADGSCRWPGRG